MNMKKLILTNFPYLLFVYPFDKLSQAFRLAPGKTLKSILISCGARLAPFDIKELRDLMETDEMELDTLGDSKAALFVIISDTDTTFNFADTGTDTNITEDVTEETALLDEETADLLSSLFGSQLSITANGGNLNVRTGAGLDKNAFTQLPNGTTAGFYQMRIGNGGQLPFGGWLCFFFY